MVNQTSTDNSRNNCRHPSSVKLPKIEMKKFSGDPANLKALWVESFDASIHSNSHLYEVSG